MTWHTVDTSAWREPDDYPIDYQRLEGLVTAVDKAGRTLSVTWKKDGKEGVAKIEWDQPKKTVRLWPSTIARSKDVADMPDVDTYGFVWLNPDTLSDPATKAGLVAVKDPRRLPKKPPKLELAAMVSKLEVTALVDARALDPMQSGLSEIKVDLLNAEHGDFTASRLAESGRPSMLVVTESVLIAQGWVLDLQAQVQAAQDRLINRGPTATRTPAQQKQLDADRAFLVQAIERGWGGLTLADLVATLSA